MVRHFDAMALLITWMHPHFLEINIGILVSFQKE